MKKSVELPQMITPVPGTKSIELSKQLKQVEMPSCSNLSKADLVFWEKAQGVIITDVDDNRFIDLTGGFCVAVAGHSNPQIASAIADQSLKMLHHPPALNPHPQRLELAQQLGQLTPGDLNVFQFPSTGSEAIDLAVKTARIHTGKHLVISFHQGFHGKSGNALAASSQNNYREKTIPNLPGTIHIPYPNLYRPVFGVSPDNLGKECANYLRYILEMPDSGVANVAAVILEAVQGHGGWNVPPVEFIQEVWKITEEHGIVLIVDEIITGFGRTGKWFGINHFDVVPDIMVFGKGMASGFPISGIATRKEIAQSMPPLVHTSTFTGHPVGCAASLASIKYIQEENLVAKSAQLGTYLKTELLKLMSLYPIIGDVRGLGLMVGVEFVEDRESKKPATEIGKKIVDRMLQKGIMANNFGGTYHNVLKLSPPLVIEKEQLDYFLAVFEDSIKHVKG